MSEVIICRACGKTKGRSKHHILPKRFFGRLEYTCNLCKKCHRQFERNWIPLCPILEPNMYWEILNQFLICKGAEPIEPPMVIPEVKRIKGSKKKLLEYQRFLNNKS
jgi:hypothetical protein